MLIYVPQQRNAAASRTWLLLIFLAPWPGLLVYSIFGRSVCPGAGANLRPYFAPAITSTPFVSSDVTSLHPTRNDSAPLLGGLVLRNPISIGSVKYGGELLSAGTTVVTEWLSPQSEFACVSTNT